jgi:alpha-tubulin suppressor-like RCC1 family protein
MIKKFFFLLPFMCFAAFVFTAYNQVQALTGTTYSVLSSNLDKIGDVNGDGEINSTDMTVLKRHLLQKIKELPVGDALWSADLNGDTFIDSTDLTLLKRYILKLIDKFPKEQENPLGEIVEFESGLSHSIILKKDGTVWALGDNSKGQLGLGELSGTKEPVMIEGLSDIVSVGTGIGHSLALKNDGTLWAWGDNYNLQLIDNIKFPSDIEDRICTIPFKVKTHSDIKTVIAGFARTLVIKNDGSVWLHSLPPIKSSENADYISWNIEGFENIKAADIVKGHVITLREDGTVWSWGENVWGQLGNGTQHHHNTYNYSYYRVTQAKGLTGIIKIAAGGVHSVALKDDGTVWTWGGNFFGEIGNNSDQYCLQPYKVEGVEDIIAIDAGSNHTVALKRDGTVWIWGKNEYGQLGIGTTVKRVLTPVMIEGLTGVKSIKAGMESTIAIKEDGTIWAWGKNDFGQLGGGTVDNCFSPVQVLIGN